LKYHAAEAGGIPAGQANSRQLVLFFCHFKLAFLDSKRGDLVMSATPTPQRRRAIDCRDYPSEKNCSLKISGTEDEVLEAAAQHAISVHGHADSPELRDELQQCLKDD